MMKNGIDTSQFDILVTKLEEALSKVETLVTEMQNIQDSIQPSDIATALSQNETLTEEQRQAMVNLAQEGEELKSVLPILAELINSASQSEQSITSTLGGLSQLVQKVKELSEAGDPALAAMNGIFKSISKLDKFSASSASLRNVVNAVKDLAVVGKDGNLPSLNIISNVDLSGFNGLQVRKTSLNNLATFLPIISKDVDVASLERLQKVNLTNFNNVTVSKSSLNAIADLANYRDSLDLFKDSVNQVIASINILNQSIATLNNKNSGNKSPESDLIKRMMDASTMAHNLLNGNINSGDMTTYKEFISTLQTIDKWLDDCGRDASKLPNAMGVSMDDASDKVNMLIERLSALKNEMVVDEKSGTFTRRGVNDTLNQMLSLRNKSGDYSGTAEFQNLESQIRLFGDAIQRCKTQGVSLNDAFKHFGTDGIIAIDAAKTSMSALKLKVTETAQSITDTKMLDKARVKSDWEIRGLEERDINKLYRQVRLMADSSTEFQAIEKKYNALINEQNIWEASGKDYTAAEIQNITAMREELKTLMEQYINDTKELNKLLNADDAKARAQQSAKWKLGGIESKDIDSLYSKVEKLPKEKAKLDEINKKYAELINTQKLWEENGKDLTAPEVQSITKLREELKTLMEQYIKTEEAKRNSASADLTAKWQSQGITESNIKSLFGKAKNNKDLFEGIEGGFEGLTERYREVLALHEKYKDKLHDENDPVVKNIENRTKALKEEIEAVLDDAAAKKKTDKTEKDKQSLLGKSAETVSRLRKEYAQWTAAAKGSTSVDYHKLKDFADSIDDLIGQLSRDEISPEEFKRKFDALTSGARQSEAAIKSVGKNTQSLGDRVKGLATKFGAWLSISQVVMAAVRAVKKMISTAQEIDAAMTQLKIVTNATDAEMKQFSNTAITLAKNLGKSVTELTKSIETFSRLGYSLKDASELAKYATIMSNVAGVSADEATTGLTSIVKGYNLDVSEAEHVADILVDVGQKYAVSASEMMDAFEKSGAALHATNTSLEKSAGLIASANASVQDSSVIGTALKTVSARVRGKNFCASVHSNMYAQELHVA